MSLVINTNVASLSAQNSIGRAQMDQNEAMERLTTGKRINTAADDAAGLAIANKMTSQVKGLNQAVRNANDGISMLQTAAGGLEETNNILQRMRELSVQSASGTYDQGNRDSMQAEVKQLQAELDRISETTTFNGQKILDGSQQGSTLQVGSNANETIGFNIDSTASTKLGGGGADITAQVSKTRLDGTEQALLDGLTTLAATAALDLIINNQSVGDLTAAPATASLQDALQVMNDNVNGVTIGTIVDSEATTVGSGIISGDDFLRITATETDGATTLQFDITNTNSLDEVVAQINEKGAGQITATLDDSGRLNVIGTDLQNFVVGGTINNGTNTLALATGLTAATNQAALTFTAEAGIDEIIITQGTTDNSAETGVQTRALAGDITGSQIASTAATQDGDLIINGVAIDGSAQAAVATKAADIITQINEKSAETGVTASLTGAAGIALNSVSGEEIKVEYGDNADASIGVQIGLAETNHGEGAGSSVNSIDISTAAGAQKAIEILDVAIEQVSTIQGELGAVNNRLDFTVSNLSNVSENAAAARSRIEDADFAAESANLSRAQVLQQAGQAMLAQANSAPQQVLSLLQ